MSHMISSRIVDAPSLLHAVNVAEELEAGCVCVMRPIVACAFLLYIAAADVNVTIVARFM